ncbi:MAG: hypothetical protein AAB362_02175 [Patescibacteria group bacterium]
MKKTYTESSNLINSTITVGLYRGFGTSATDVYKRYWYRTSGFTYGIVGTKHMYTEGQRPYFYSANLFGSREMTIVTQTVAECGYSTCNLYPNMASRPLADNVWYCIEEHTKLNTPGQANGVVELWVNGVQTIGYYNRTFLGPNVSNPNGNSSTHTLSGVKFYKEGGNGAIYYDQVAVGNTRIGCGGTPPPSDPSSPPSSTPPPGGGTTPTPPPSTAPSLNARVKTTAVLNVRATASITGTLLGTQALNAQGRVIGGPINQDGFIWWNIDYDTGADGWSAENYLLNITPAPAPPPTPTPTPPPPPPPPPLQDPSTFTPSTFDDSSIVSFIRYLSAIAGGRSAQPSSIATSTATSSIIDAGTISAFSISEDRTTINFDITGATNATNNTTQTPQATSYKIRYGSGIDPLFSGLTPEELSVVAPVGAEVLIKARNDLNEFFRLNSQYTSPGSDPNAPSSGLTSVEEQKLIKLKDDLIKLFNVDPNNTSPVSATNPTPPPTPPSPTNPTINARVKTTAVLNVRATASITGTLLGTQALNAQGRVIGGPINQDGFAWWRINYDNGADGWSVENYLLTF